MYDTPKKPKLTTRDTVLNVYLYYVIVNFFNTY